VKFEKRGSDISEETVAPLGAFCLGILYVFGYGDLDDENLGLKLFFLILPH